MTQKDKEDIIGGVIIFGGVFLLFRYLIKSLPNLS
jgi:hypothetical protein